VVKFPKFLIQECSVSQVAILALEDGAIFKGKSIGASGQTLGEVVFNTSMTGYQTGKSDIITRFEIK
jgi:hypothetical protein